MFLPNIHPGYISWEEFEANQTKLLANANGYGEDRRKSPPREGAALLQGVVICGVCGLRMTVRYHVDHGHPLPDYVCQRHGIQTAAPSANACLAPKSIKQSAKSCSKPSLPLPWMWRWRFLRSCEHDRRKWIVCAAPK